MSKEGSEEFTYYMQGLYTAKEFIDRLSKEDLITLYNILRRAVFTDDLFSMKRACDLAALALVNVRYEELKV